MTGILPEGEDPEGHQAQDPSRLGLGVVKDLQCRQVLATPPWS
jgi:hypothetical protein